MPVVGLPVGDDDDARWVKLQEVRVPPENPPAEALDQASKCVVGMTWGRR